MAKIQKIIGSYALDSHGLPALKTTVILSDGSIGEAIVSSSTKNGKYSSIIAKQNNSVEISDIGQSIDKMEYIISPKLIGREAQNQEELDTVLLEIDGTRNKSRLGADTTLCLSIALARASAHSQKMPLYEYFLKNSKTEKTNSAIPKIIYSLINGGVDSEQYLDFKDFLIVPSTIKSVKESLQTALMLNRKLVSTLKKKDIPVLYSSQGGLVMSLPDNNLVFDIFDEAFGSINLKLGYDFFWGIDVCADDLYDGEKYVFECNPIPSLSTSDLTSFYLSLIREKQVYYIEDPFASDDLEGWLKLNSRTGEETIITGNLMTAGNPARMQTAIGSKLISGISLNPIQNGTITECLLAANIARLSGIKIIVHQPPGSACDNYIADLSIAIKADYVNLGPLGRGENVLNYNRLLEIETEITSK